MSLPLRMNTFRLHTRFHTIALLLSFVWLSLLFACSDAVYLPKPRAYPKVLYPEKAYVSTEADYCAFTFERPVYGEMVQDTLFFGEKPLHPCWFNLEVSALNAKIHCSYAPIRSKADFDELVADAFTITQKHNQKASYIEEYRFDRPGDRVHGMIFEVEGPVASSYQFFVTDSVRHFLRGSLYFDTQARPDSLAPVIAFLKKDVDHMLETLHWKP
jgi:gliding motility-associated lipoprotein GldD